VNADDWGFSSEVTDAIAECYLAGAITSTSAMVFQADTERSAEMSAKLSIPTGLHINLTVPFHGNRTAIDLQRQQRTLSSVLGTSSGRSWSRHIPRALTPIARLIRLSVRAQLSEFQRVFGHEPTHIDSHHHIHGSVAFVSSQREIPLGTRMRRNFTRDANLSDNDRKAAWMRALIDSKVITRRYRTTNSLIPIGTGIAPELPRLVRGRSIEVVTHPYWPSDREILLSDEWLSALANVPSGSWLDLKA